MTNPCNCQPLAPCGNAHTLDDWNRTASDWTPSSDGHTVYGGYFPHVQASVSPQTGFAITYGNTSVGIGHPKTPFAGQEAWIGDKASPWDVAHFQMLTAFIMYFDRRESNTAPLPEGDTGSHYWGMGPNSDSPGQLLGDLGFVVVTADGDVDLNTVGIGVFDRVSGFQTTLHSFTWTEGASYFLRYEVAWGQFQRVKVWSASIDEPGPWNVSRALATLHDDAATYDWTYLVNAGHGQQTSPYGDEIPHQTWIQPITFYVCTNPTPNQPIREEAVGTGDGVTTAYTTVYPYITGTLSVAVAGILSDVDMTTPSTGTFTLVNAPPLGASIVVNYRAV